MSNHRKRTMALPLTLSALGLALVYVIVEQWTAAPIGLAKPALAAPAKSSAPFAPSRSGPTVPPLAALTETASRPLFQSSRRPPAIEEAAAPAVERIEGGQFALVGVAVFGRQRIALLRRRASGDVVRVVRGQRVDGWRVTEIAPKHVVLQRGEVSEQLRLFDFASVKPRQRPVPIAANESTGDQPADAPAAPSSEKPDDRKSGG